MNIRKWLRDNCDKYYVSLENYEFGKVIICFDGDEIYYYTRSKYLIQFYNRKYIDVSPNYDVVIKNIIHIIAINNPDKNYFILGNEYMNQELLQHFTDLCDKVDSKGYYWFGEVRAYLSFFEPMIQTDNKRFKSNELNNFLDYVSHKANNQTRLGFFSWFFK